MKKIFLLCLVFMLSFSLSACSLNAFPFLGNNFENVFGNILRENSASAEDASVASHAKEDENASLETDGFLLVNESKETISYAYIAKSGSDAWSEDLFGNKVLGGFEEVSLVMPTTSGLYDFRLHSEAGKVYEFKNLVLEANETLVFTDKNGGTIEHYNANGDLFAELTSDSETIAPEIEQEEGAYINFENGLTANVPRLYMSPSDDPSWGDNHLNETLFADDSITLAIEDNVSYDLMLEFEDDTVAEFYDMTLYSANTLSLTQSGSGYIVEMTDANGNFSEEFYDTSSEFYTAESFNTPSYAPG